MKAVFFKCQIPLEISHIDPSGNISILTEMKDIEQGAVFDVNYDESLMEFQNGAIWWSPDRNLFQIVGVPTPPQSCCGGSSV